MYGQRTRLGSSLVGLITRGRKNSAHEDCRAKALCTLKTCPTNLVTWQIFMSLETGHDDLRHKSFQGAEVPLAQPALGGLERLGWWDAAIAAVARIEPAQRGPQVLGAEVGP